MAPNLIIPNIIEPAFRLLPMKFDSPAAQAMLYAIGLQESGFMHRVQVNGPAHGYWQFERSGGVHGVRTHPLTKPIITSVLKSLDYTLDDVGCYQAIVDNDVLACCFARLLLWTIPDPLPLQGEFEEAWNQYLETWRPGKPRKETWTKNYADAWHAVNDAKELA